MSSPPTRQDVAEDAFAYLEHEGVDWDRRHEFVLRNVPGPQRWSGLALRPRLTDVETGIAYTRAWFEARGRNEYMWFVSDASRPADLADRLLAAGAEPDSENPIYTGMTLEREPELVPDVEVRKVATFEEHCVASEAGWITFHFTEAEKSELRSALREQYEALQRETSGDSFIAVIDGEVVGSGRGDYLSCGVYLAGGYVVEAARGRGVYRALVRARREEAVRRGTPTLIVQAGELSRPILERLGFASVCFGQLLVDRTG